MDKKAKKRIQTLQQRLQKLRRESAGVRQQADDPEELAAFELKITQTEEELAKLKAS